MLQGIQEADGRADHHISCRVPCIPARSAHEEGGQEHRQECDPGDLECFYHQGAHICKSNALCFLSCWMARYGIFRLLYKQALPRILAMVCSSHVFLFGLTR